MVVITVVQFVDVENGISTWKIHWFLQIRTVVNFNPRARNM